MQRYFIVSVLMLFFSSTNPIYASETLVFGLYANEKPSTIIKKFRPILQQLEVDLTHIMGREISIETDIAPSYEQGINRLTSGLVDFARFGPASYIKAKDIEPKIQIIAVESNNGNRHFKGVICTQPDSFNTLANIRGHSFAFGGKSSTVGRYLSQHILLKNNIYASNLSSFDYLSRHDKVGIAVSKGLYDAGALKFSTYQSLIQKGYKLKAIYYFDVPTKPWIIREGLDKDTADALQTSLLSFNNKDALRILKKSGFLMPKKDQFNVIGDAIAHSADFFSK
ncbi:hypothetical protein A9Q81_14280 [Gammaproteobacteria bacterium 42_54_T18]|nr:hypothetical protein A9Q81_14280 [Gammaproteobacteria bacterium 42_54_T18]